MPLGVPHSIFLGRVQEPGEPYWLEEDQDLAIAFGQAQSDACPKCHTHDDEWRDETGRLYDIPPYEAVTHRCRGCQVSQETKEQLDTIEDLDARGMFIRLAPTDPIEYMPDDD